MRKTHFGGKVSPRSTIFDDDEGIWTRKCERNQEFKLIVVIIFQLKFTAGIYIVIISWFDFVFFLNEQDGTKKKWILFFMQSHVMKWIHIILYLCFFSLHYKREFLILVGLLLGGVIQSTAVQYSAYGVFLLDYSVFPCSSSCPCSTLCILSF